MFLANIQCCSGPTKVPGGHERPLEPGEEYWSSNAPLDPIAGVLRIILSFSTFGQTFGGPAIGSSPHCSNRSILRPARKVARDHQGTFVRPLQH